MNVEFSSGVICPLERGNEGLEFNNVTVDGGAKTTMSATDQDTISFPYDARPQRLQESQEKKQAILESPQPQFDSHRSIIEGRRRILEVIDGRSTGRADDDFRSIVDDRERANLRNQPKTTKQHEAGLKNLKGMFLKVSELDISRNSDGYDGRATRQMANSLGANVGLEKGMRREMGDLQAMVNRPPSRQML